MTDRQKYRELYWCWKAIKQRCLNPRCRAYRNYGGRGVTVCDDIDLAPFIEVISPIQDTAAQEMNAVDILARIRSL